MQFYGLEKLINLHEGYRRAFKIDAHQLLLLQVDGECYLIERYCPHREQALDNAESRGGTLVCPKHHYRFDLDSGAVIRQTEEPCRKLRRYPLVYEGTEVGVML